MADGLDGKANGRGGAGDTGRVPLTLRVEDPGYGWTSVRLCSDLDLPDPALQRRDGAWLLALPRLALERLEYELEVTYPGGETERIADPSHARRAPGAFGEKSVLEAASYRPPAWLDAPRVPGSLSRVQLGIALRRRVTAELWAPGDTDPAAALPLLIAHDGPELARLAALTDWAGAMIAAGHLPPFRLALLPPGDRNNWYSASEGYARAFASTLVPALHAEVAVRGPVAGMGVSLGALALLHIHRRLPGLLGGLFLQSGSFFTLETDPQEQGFSRFGRITPFVRGVLRTRHYEHPIRVAMTCGTEEENTANNRAMAQALHRQSYRVFYEERPYLHNFTGWRDSFEPQLSALLAAVWG